MTRSKEAYSIEAFNDSSELEPSMAVKTDNNGDVHRFRLARSFFGRQLYWTAAYLVDGLLIDTGPKHTVREFVKELDNHEIEMVVNTHSHEDHVGANAQINELFKVKIVAHEKALSYLADPSRMELHPYQLIMWGRPEASLAEPVSDKIDTGKYSFKVLETHGHGEDHICLFEPNKGWLFSGDMYVGGEDKALRTDFNVWKIIDSLKYLAAFEPEVIFSGSGSIKTDATDELKRKIQFLETTGTKVLELHKKGVSVNEIRKRIIGPELLIRYITLGHYSGWNLINSFIIHRP